MIDGIAITARQSRTICAAQRAAQIMCSPFGRITVGSCCIGIAVFYSCEWILLRIGLAEIIAALFRVTGHAVSRNLHNLTVDNTAITITTECTYVDWILIAAPFVWRRDKARINLYRTLALILTATLVNICRIYGAVAGQLYGISWFWAHDFVDGVLWYPSLVLMILGWLLAAERSQVSSRQSVPLV
jgi:hypothetical protein